jgi:hypothetical protein
MHLRDPWLVAGDRKQALRASGTRMLRGQGSHRHRWQHCSRERQGRGGHWDGHRAGRHVAHGGCEGRRRGARAKTGGSRCDWGDLHSTASVRSCSLPKLSQGPVSVRQELTCECSSHCNQAASRGGESRPSPVVLALRVRPAGVHAGAGGGVRCVACGAPGLAASLRSHHPTAQLPPSSSPLLYQEQQVLFTKRICHTFNQGSISAGPTSRGVAPQISNSPSALAATDDIQQGGPSSSARYAPAASVGITLHCVEAMLLPSELSAE